MKILTLVDEDKKTYRFPVTGFSYIEQDGRWIHVFTMNTTQGQVSFPVTNENLKALDRFLGIGKPARLFEKEPRR